MVDCADCGKANASDARFCSQCGLRLDPRAVQNAGSVHNKLWRLAANVRSLELKSLVLATGIVGLVFALGWLGKTSPEFGIQAKRVTTQLQADLEKLDVVNVARIV